MRTYGRVQRSGAKTPGFVGLNATISGTTFTSIGGNERWNSGVYATNGFDTCVVSMELTEASGGATWFGLNNSPVLPTGNDPDSGPIATYGIYFHKDSSFTGVYVNGARVLTTTSPSIGDIGVIAYSGVNAYFYINGALIYTTASISPGSNVYPTWSTFYSGTTASLTVNPVGPGVGTKWVEVTTDANGNNDLVYFTTLAQVLKLSLGESPFFANYGIPARQSVMQQVWPDFYVALTQQTFAPFFASLLLSKSATAQVPTYTITAITHAGVPINTQVVAS